MSTLSNRTRRGSVAISRERHRANAILALLANYKVHAPFRTEMLQLADDLKPTAFHIVRYRGNGIETILSHFPMHDLSSTYTDTIVRFAQKWGLDRIDGSVGLNAVHSWLLFKFDLPEEDGSSFGYGLSLESDEPDIDLSILQDATWDPETEPWVGSEILIDEKYRPMYGWRMRRYDRGASRRLKKELGAEKVSEIESQHTRIRSEYLNAGYVWPDNETKFARNIEWVFNRLALRLPLYQIADIATLAETSGRVITEERVRSATDELQVRMNISSYPEVPRKPKRDARSA